MYKYQYLTKMGTCSVHESFYLPIPPAQHNYSLRLLESRDRCLLHSISLSLNTSLALSGTLFKPLIFLKTNIPISSYISSSSQCTQPSLIMLWSLQSFIFPIWGAVWILSPSNSLTVFLVLSNLCSNFSQPN